MPGKTDVCFESVLNERIFPFLSSQDADSSDDSDDDEAELLAELNKIKKERAREQAAKVDIFSSFFCNEIYLINVSKV